MTSPTHIVADGRSRSLSHRGVSPCPEAAPVTPPRRRPSASCTRPGQKQGRQRIQGDVQPPATKPWRPQRPSGTRNVQQRATEAEHGGSPREPAP